MQDFPELFGISERDFQIYRLLNAYGAMPASTIAVRLKMNRTTIFSALRRLTERGLVYETPRKSGTLFSSVETGQILRQREENLRKEAESIARLSEAMAVLLKEKSALQNKPSVAFYEGEEGVISLFDSMLEMSKSQEAFLTLEKIPLKILQYLQGDFIKAKKKRNVFSRVLVPQSDRANKYRELDKQGNRETRLVPPDARFETEIVIAGNHVALIDFQTPSIGVRIDSAHIANTMRAVFELLWKKHA